uniref:Ig-like domain-containing protein n=1 Tax=Sinocyclocheilus grahami TaxID=75366 RepID=A0A672L432_SINGR
MATSFFKDVTLIIKKYCTSLPEYEDESTGIRPNHEVTFQLKKSVEIQENDKAEYSYFVTHILRHFRPEADDCNFFAHILLLFAAEKHSLYYIYTALSKPVDLPGIYQFTAMAQLDDIQIDYYNSREQRKIPKQTWMKEKLYEDYWEEGTQSRKSKEHWFNVNIDILMKRMRHSESDLHVFQMRTGCEVERWGSEEKFSKGVYEYGYDGENFLSFDDSGSLQFTQLYQPRVNIPFLNQYTKGYLGKNCVDWLKKFTEYGENELRNGSPPDVHMFAKRSTSDKIKLTCMVTSFYPKDTVLFIRKYRTSLPEDETESTGIRPNQDGAFQLCKSVEIQENEKANYDCFVAHRTLKEPIITKWGN